MRAMKLATECKATTCRPSLPPLAAAATARWSNRCRCCSSAGTDACTQLHLAGLTHSPAAMASAADIPALVQRLRGGSRMAQLQAARQLEILAEGHGEEAAAAIAAAGGLPSLLQLLRSGSAAVQGAAARAILGVTSKEQFAPALALAVRDCGLDPPAVKRLLSAPDDSTAAVAACIVGIMACLAPGATSTSCPQLPDLLAAGIATDLVMLLGCDGSLAQIGAQAAMIAISSTPAGASALLEAGTISRLVPLLSHPLEYLHQPACTALCSIAVHSHDNSAAVVSSGAVLPLLKLLRASGEGTSGGSGSASASSRDAALSVNPIEWAARALACLCGASVAACLKVEAGGGLPLLERIAGHATGQLQRHAADAFACVQRWVPLPVGYAALWWCWLMPSSQDSFNVCIVSWSQRRATAALPEAAGGQHRAREAPAQQAAPQRTCAAPGCGTTRGLKRCGGCGAVRYCSEACSRAHWRAHKAECRRVQAVKAAAAGAATGAETAESCG